MTSREESRDQEMRVSGGTPTKDLAEAITSHIREGKDITLVCIGANAIAQAVKAVPVVNGHLAPRGLIFTILPAFAERTITDEETGAVLKRTAMLLKIVRYNPR